MAGRSSPGSSTALISPTMGRSSARSCPGSAGLAFTEGSGHQALILPRPAVTLGPCPRLPLEIEDIKAILPHRYPFLLVDRIIELEEDRRIVGVKNVASDERYFIAGPGGRPVLPASILTEAMAQAGAVLILSKPENRSRLIYFMGIDKVRYRRPVGAGDTVLLEGIVVRLRGKIGSLQGVARVDGQVVCEGRMTFALGDPAAGAASR